MSFNIIFELYIAPSEQQHEDDIHILYINLVARGGEHKKAISAHISYSPSNLPIFHRAGSCKEEGKCT